MYIILLLIPVFHALELPLAPYNVKVFCRQGRRYSRRVQTALQCSSSTTACGYFEFSSPDTKTGVNSVGIYECVDNGILQTTNDDLEEDNSKLFSQICGAVAQCSHLNLDILNPAFVKYLVLHHDIQLESLTSRTIRFCCSLFHHTLQKLVTSEKDRLPSISATPIHCQSELCGEEAVGCLFHSKSEFLSSEEYDEEDGDDGQGEVTVRRQKAKRQTNEYQEIDAVQLSFDFNEELEEEEDDDHSLQLVTRAPHRPSPSSHSLRPPELKLSLTAVTTSQGRSQPNTTLSTTPKYTKSENDDEEESYCVYRHLNDEMYRYCLLVHQKKDGDRCYYHDGHTICCCFVPPDKETCDPTEVDLKQPPVSPKLPSIRVTPRPKTAILASTRAIPAAPTTTTTAAPSTTTVSTTTTSPKSPSSKSRIITTKHKTLNKRCRIAYPRKKISGSKARPVVVCDFTRSAALLPSLCVLVVHNLLVFL